VNTIVNTFLKILGFFDQRKWAIFLLGIVLGLVLGLFYTQWRVNSLQWKDAGPHELREDFRSAYLVWVAENYESQRLNEPDWAYNMLIGTDWDTRDDAKEYAKRVADALETLAQECIGPNSRKECNDDDAPRLRGLAQDLKNIAGVDISGEEPAAQGGTNWFMLCIGVAVVFLFLGGVGFLIYRWLRGRQEEQEVRESIAERVRPVAPVSSWGAEGPPLAQFPSTYVLGDDHFDPSFSIELENGEFMGECGVGISETIGVGAPSKVTAFEVWLFDKSDIRTLTKVVMSPYAFSDEALRAKLAPKGEPIQAKEGTEIILETKTLRIKARIIEAKYGTGNLPQNSFFEQLSIDLAAWVKPAPAGGEFALEEDTFDLS
jgi:hypothetical protein